MPHIGYAGVMRLIGYIRVSRVAGRNGDSFISPSVQRETIARHARGAGHQIVEILEDLDQPGSRDDRPEFQRALDAVERGEAEGIIVAKLDRFARSVAGAARALERLETAGGTLVAVDLGMDTSTPAGRLMRNVLTALAEFELDRIRESWTQARDSAIARGVHISRVPAVGYQRREDGRLEPDPVAAPIVAEVFRRRAAGHSWEALCDYLDTALPRDNGGGWTRQTISSMIPRRVYLGEAHQGSAVNTEAHEPIVSRSEWEAAQVAGEQTRRRETKALLAGILRCAACGYTMTRQSDGKRGYANYRCRVRHGSGICPEPARISERRADEHAEHAFLTWLEGEGIAVDATEPSDGVAAALARVEAAGAELVAYRDTGLVTVIGREAFVAGLAQRQQVLDEARQELEQARRSNVALPLEPSTLLETWPSLSNAEKRPILASAIDAIAVRRADLPGKGSSVPGRMRIFWRGEAPADLPGRGSTGIRPLPIDYSPDQVRAA
jgi:site-specific DNA recombinase